MSDADGFFFDQFATSARRLVKLLDLNAPGEVLAREAALIFHRAGLAFGEEAYKALGRAIRTPSVLAKGFCIECESRYQRLPNQELMRYPDMCPKCREKCIEEDPEIYGDPNEN